MIRDAPKPAPDLYIDDQACLMAIVPDRRSATVGSPNVADVDYPEQVAGGC
jgi:hypothetical protein